MTAFDAYVKIVMLHENLKLIQIGHNVITNLFFGINKLGFEVSL